MSNNKKKIVDVEVNDKTEQKPKSDKWSDGPSIKEIEATKKFLSKIGAKREP